MRRVGQGDAQAYRILSERYLQGILRFATRVLGDAAEAEDVVQETFLRMWQRAGEWQPGAKVGTWLHHIAHNLCLDRLRRRRPQAEEDPDLGSGEDRPSGLLARKAIAAGVQAALDELPERQRVAVTLVHYQGFSNTEAAEVLGCGVEAVESLLARARRSLRQQLVGVSHEWHGGEA